MLCWECETVTARRLTASLRLPGGGSRALELCPSCHRMLRVALAANAEGEVSFDADRHAAGGGQGTPTGSPA